MSSCQSCNNSATPTFQKVIFEENKNQYHSFALGFRVSQIHFIHIESRTGMFKADGSLNESLFYSDNLHLVKEGNEILANEIVAFSKYLMFHNCPTARSYKSIASFYLNNSDFPTLTTCYSNYSSSKVKLNGNASFQKSFRIAFVDSCKYVSKSKSYILPSVIRHHTERL